MKLFLLTYDRSRQKLVDIREFDPGEYEDANRHLLETELAHPTWEVVLLEAPSREALRRTHGRYFEEGVAVLRPRAASS